MKEGSKNVLKIILWIFLGILYFTSLYFSYLYIIDIKQKTTPPEEILIDSAAERRGYFGVVTEISSDKIKFTDNDTGLKMEATISPNTSYTKYIITKNERSDAKFEDIAVGSQVTVVAWQNPNDGTYNADNIEVTLEE